jgi:small subunit ribosomal protein S6
LQNKMREYETVLVLDPSLEEDAIHAEVDKWKGLIESHGGQVAKVDVWGRRKLAYEIKKQREGVYVLLEFQGPPGIARELDHDLRVSEAVLRHLTVLKSEKMATAQAEPEEEPTSERHGEDHAKE